MKNKKTLIILVVLFAISFIYTKIKEADVVLPTQSTEGNLTVSFLDVGQGDSQFIQFPNGKCMLIDASTKDMGERIEEFIKNSGFEKIDYLVATHPHSDHIGGMQYIAENFEIGTVYMTEAVTTTNTFSNLLNTIKDKNIPVKRAKNGVQFSEGDVELEFLSPLKDNYEDLNNWSVVLKITYKESKFLFTGDAEQQTEYDLLTYDKSVDSDVLKVAHHGSSSSSVKEFLEEVSPDIAVIQCGTDNEYGHPHKEVIKRLENINAEIYRTDLDGTVVVTTNGEEIDVL